jgi:hypothetical protein
MTPPYSQASLKATKKWTEKNLSLGKCAKCRQEAVVVAYIQDGKEFDRVKLAVCRFHRDLDKARKA